VRTAAIVVAAGAGERFGSRKQFAELAGRSTAAWSVEAARGICDVIVLVVPPDAVDVAHGADVVVAGGATRAASVRAGLAALDADVDVVVVHDAARPLATPALFQAVVDAIGVDGVVGAIPAIDLVDTIKRVDDDRVVVETLERSGLVAVQTPQAFVADVLRRAHEGDPEATDDAALVEAAGGRVVVVQGEPDNRKVTTRDDLEVARALLAHR
jgi:2-C-methyl-D-erythritol 4-phosphate cytidylyltransferase